MVDCKKCGGKGWEEAEICNLGECPNCCELPLGKWEHKE